MYMHVYLYAYTYEFAYVYVYTYANAYAYGSACWPEAGQMTASGWCPKLGGAHLQCDLII